jgi:CheY-like chemotaxis protein
LVDPQPSAGCILVVDDADYLRDLLASVLGRAGYRVVSAANGSEALAYLRRGERVDLILLDLVMPLMDGWQFRAEQLKDPRLTRIPVIVLSGERNLAYQAETLGVDAYLEKPAPVTLLLRTVRALLPMERTAAVMP